MKKTIPSIPTPSVLFVLTTTLLLLLDILVAEPRAEMVQITCGNQLEHNSTVFVPNFIASMENISEQMRTTGFGVAVTGSGPDDNYGLGQCYGDLSLPDCVLCYAEARSILPQCFPFTSGRIYLDGCFMRAQNSSFFEEYTGPEDRAFCGNTTQKDSAFQKSARQAVLQAASDAPSNNGFARVQVPVAGTANESAYVLSDCWRTLDERSCRACLQNASNLILGCLPWSEGRALNTGCFMRYSDTNFLNPELQNGSSRGIITTIVVAVISSVVVLVIGAVIGFYTWKRMKIQKKRRGSNDVEKLAKTLDDSCLNFKYSTLEKATGSFDNANKLGQGGFGTVYKAWKHFQLGTLEEFFDPNLMLHNYHNSSIKNDVLRVVHIGLLCTQEAQSLRPSMSKALVMLVKKDGHLPAPTKPPFIDEKTMELNDMHENPCYPLNAANSDSIATVSQNSFYPR
ncbi:hypothetical protein F0562_033287 [Nyssa sinensis]|uniref:Gnk2-homologous domain-containing protein n=1 Tax=Nyssa sinensis TaxID=561372 RepID=A0A5J5ARJ7_9ASTE|nr:hypothetical protein F0562_033287 [Nyssa sinensis]